jgi:ubiquinone/menaquinone biosynthesis C-methylase UbiE
MATPPRRALNDTVARGFDLLARRYDTPWIQRWVYRPPQDAILEQLRARGSRRIVDVGCGTGILADRIQRELQPDEVMGVDPSEGMLSKAKARSSAVRWIVGPAEKLPLPDDSVDAVISTTAFQFFDQPAALAEFGRVLAPGGIVALGTITQPLPAPEPIQWIVRRWRTPAHHPSAAELRNLLNEAGFQLVEQRKVQSWASRWLMFSRITVGVKPAR